MAISLAEACDKALWAIDSVRKGYSIETRYVQGSGANPAGRYISVMREKPSINAEGGTAQESVVNLKKRIKEMGGSAAILGKA